MDRTTVGGKQMRSDFQQSDRLNIGSFICNSHTCPVSTPAKNLFSARISSEELAFVGTCHSIRWLIYGVSPFQWLVWLSAGDEFLAVRIRKKVQLKISNFCLEPESVHLMHWCLHPLKATVEHFWRHMAFLFVHLFLFLFFLFFVLFLCVWVQIQHICAVEFSRGGGWGAWIIDALIFWSLFMDCNHLQLPFKRDSSKCCVIFAVIIQRHLAEYLSFIIKVYLFASLRANLGWSTWSGFVKHDSGRRVSLRNFKLSTT